MDDELREEIQELKGEIKALKKINQDMRERLIKEGIWKDNRKSNTPDNTEGEISNE